MRTDTTFARYSSLHLREKVSSPTSIRKTWGERVGSEFPKPPAGDQAGTFASQFGPRSSCPFVSALARWRRRSPWCGACSAQAKGLGGSKQMRRGSQVCGTWGSMEPRGAIFWLENLPLATGPFGSSFYPSIRAARLHKLQGGVRQTATPDAVTLGEFLLPEYYRLRAPSPLEIGITNFLLWPNDWDKAAIAPPPSLYLGGREQGASPTGALVAVQLVNAFVPLSPRSWSKLRL